MNKNTEKPISKITEEIFNSIIESNKKDIKGQYTYIIGNNGTGKSRILGELSERLKKISSTRITACISSTIHDRFINSDHESVIYMGLRNANNAVFIAAIERQLTKFILQAMQLNRKSFQHLIDVVNMDLSFSLGEKSIETILTPPSIPTRDSERIIKRATELNLLSPRPISMLKKILDSKGRFEKLTQPQISVLLKYLETNIDITVKIEIEGGKEINFGDLSTGEQNRLLLFSKIISVMKNGTIYLIDEPEISLHLHWQMEFHKTLKKLLSNINHFNVIVATHSPTIISEAVKNDQSSPENIVAVLRREDNTDIRSKNVKSGTDLVICEFHSFTEVASHDQLVLRYFQTSPYQTREVSVEIANTVLDFAEGNKDKTEALEILKELKLVAGLSEKAEQQITAALDLINRDLINSIKMSNIQ